MKKLLLCFTLSLIVLHLFSQDKNPVKAASLGVNFFFNDFKSAEIIRSSSLSSTLLKKDFGRNSQMSPGLGISFLKGICSQVDFAAMLGGSFLDYTTANGKALGTSAFLLEVDASLHAKLLPDNYLIVPYLSAGVGFSKYKGYYGAIMPVGVGLQIGIYKDTFILIDSQYRIKVSESTNYHFLHSIGIVGSLESL